MKHAAHASPCMFSRLERDVSVFFCCGPSRISATSVWCMKRCTRWILFLISCDHGYTLRQRGEQCPQLFRWRFDDCVFFLFCTTRLRNRLTASLAYSPQRGKTEVFVVDGGHLVLGLASGLEAFSREPPCDSVGALAVRQTPETRGTAWEFLSYYPILPSRYLRDPFTISRE